ncbi:MAG: (d)CMP kinase [Candidatus Pacebacteria bacterium]|nr:(d)CMP kinase [Candidatus Paceibacterota bacterium]MBT3511622.1 (d)CMP kinase [Candidatus Paceibacterota bacterium]MBT4004711.1 (d)CMP kinase [Candidatus Paceibacterota bacterium]MBT4359249.1 (d)CMP kinase [Candidatus Paceibacterota bacterium]MBT4681029.1 (d)CMP kinase [Candidatus Paceibacterota bacterium]
MQIAIDGPVAAGKSTIAKIISSRLGMTYVDTGAMYRALALAALRADMDWDNAQAMEKLAQKIKIRLARPIGKKNDGRPVSVYLDNEDISWKIRESEMGEGASVVGTHPEVRKILVKLQQEMCNGNDVVMEGRDIGSKVLPHADLKIFMIADQDVRVKRKRKYLTKVGEKLTRKQVQADLVSRDTREMTREVDPLRPTLDAWQLDTTHMSIEEVIDTIVKKVEEIS